jgi:uncharacterized protein (TIGR02246 family)
VIWGSPYGQTLVGYDELHAIHRRLQAERSVGHSRHEIVSARRIAPDVVISQVWRQAIDADGTAMAPDQAFSEMALYVLVQRNGAWWLAAGQNTPVDAASG